MPEEIENLCLKETDYSVISISTLGFVPQPVRNKAHFIQNRIFVGNFSPTTEVKELASVFRQFGEIIECNIVSVDSTRRCGFVSFATVDSAQKVLNLHFKGNNFVLNGCQLNIGPAHFKPKKRPASYRPRAPNSENAVTLGHHVDSDSLQPVYMQNFANHGMDIRRSVHPGLMPHANLQNFTNQGAETSSPVVRSVPLVHGQAPTSDFGNPKGVCCLYPPSVLSPNGISSASMVPTLWPQLGPLQPPIRQPPVMLPYHQAPMPVYWW